jgi:hypothetical protein
MQNRTHHELYRAFMDFVVSDIQSERRAANRRMFSVLLWCFIVPVIASAATLLLIRSGLLAPSARGYLDWIVLLCPVLYTLYILASEVLAELPTAYRRGGVAGSLSQALKDSEWRDRTCESMKKAVEARPEEWDWISSNFQMDLERMQHRNRYITGLAGAVFFLIMQGIDAIGDTEEKVTWIRGPMGWIEAGSSSNYQFIGLALFLLLFYLSGHQTYQSLSRYLNCADLIRKK